MPNKNVVLFVFKRNIFLIAFKFFKNDSINKIKNKILKFSKVMNFFGIMY